MKENINYIDIYHHSEGIERKKEILHDMLDNGTLLPKTVEYKDIDEAFKEWVDKDLEILSDEGVVFPTMSLYSNQRFSEYAQTWKYTDSLNNILLNFKTVTRENNPKYGKIQTGLWNIPGERFYTMKKKKVLDDNGSESFQVLKMRQPTAIDLSYKISILTTKYQKINEFNTLINRLFNSCQVYIQPNGHFMPMKLDSINDESEYRIDDRQFYSQTYNILVMAYIITEDDYRIEEVPLKNSINFGMRLKKKKAEVEVYECEKEEPRYYYAPLTIEMNFDECINKSTFTIDFNFVVTSVKLDNVNDNYSVSVNGEKIDNVIGSNLNDGDNIIVNIKHRNPLKKATLYLYGYDKDNVCDSKNDVKELIEDEVNNETIVIVN